MTAAEYQALANQARAETLEYQGRAEQHTLTGRVFDHNAPLPPAPNYRPREWETDTKDRP